MSLPTSPEGKDGLDLVWNAEGVAPIIGRSARQARYLLKAGIIPSRRIGRSYVTTKAEVIAAVLGAAQGVPARMVTAPVWKRHVGIPAGRDGVKDMARTEACRRWPGHADRFAAKGSDGLAEAGLIAVAGMAREARG